MASNMVFSFRVLENNARNYILQAIGADATTTTAATQDGNSTGIIAANGYTPTVHLKVRRILYSTWNCVALLQWHASSNVNLAMLNGYGDLNMTDKLGMSPQGIWDDAGSGISGDIDLYSYALATVTGGSGLVTASMTLVLFCTKGA